MLNKSNPILEFFKVGVEKNTKFKKTNLDFTYQWITPPNIDELSSLDLTFDKEISEYSIEAEINMPEHHHGSSPIVIEQDEQNLRIIHLTELSFFMSGRWVLTVKLMQKNKEIDSWEQDIILQ